MEFSASPKTSRRTAPPGFLPFKSHNRPLQELTTRELNDRYLRNKSILDGPGPSTASHQRLLNEQTAIENILGIEHLRDTLYRTHLTEDDPMGESAGTPSVSRVVDTKKRVLGRYYDQSQQQRGTTMALGLDEAIALEQQAHVAEMERKKSEEEKRSRRLPRPGENLTQEEVAARIWAYMNRKPTESDEEDEDWNESGEDDDDDPATWFEGEDETQGQPLIDPDELADIIRVDDSHWHN